MEKIEKRPDKREYSKEYLIDIYTKDNRVFKFCIKSESKKLYGLLVELKNPKELTSFYNYAYNYRRKYQNNFDSNKDKSINKIDGWKIYDFNSEFLRQGLININSNFEDINKIEEYKAIRIFDKNKNFSVCLSYPEILIVPKGMDDRNIIESSKYRTKGRFPSKNYFY